MNTRRTLAPGQKGTKKFLDRYGEQLFCVRYRYDEQTREQAGTDAGCDFGWSRKDNVSFAARSLSTKATGTSTICKGEWMAETMRCRIWSCYTRTAIGKFINEVGDLRNRVP